MLFRSVKAQVKRRTNDPATLLISIETLLKTESELARKRMACRKEGKVPETYGTIGTVAEKISALLGISSSSVERLLKASKDPDIRKAILENVYDSINAAHEAAKAAAMKVTPSEKTVPVPLESANNELPDTITDCAETEGQEPTDEDEPIEAEIIPKAITYEIYLSHSIMRKILYLIANEHLEELKSICKEAKSKELDKLVAGRINPITTAA